MNSWKPATPISSSDITDKDCNSQNIEIEALRLSKAWKCILDQYVSLPFTTAAKEGSGISVFKMLRRSKHTLENQVSNCEYYYAEKDSELWKTIVAHSDPEVFSRYDPENMVAICVSIPLYEEGDETIQSIKLFDMNRREIF